MGPKIPGGAPEQPLCALPQDDWLKMPVQENIARQNKMAAPQKVNMGTQNVN